MHYYKRNLGDYAKKAGRLSMLQHGAYTLLIDACYDREQFPTLEEAMDWTWASSTPEREAVEFVLGKFFTLEDGRYVQNRIKEELESYKEVSETNARIARDRETKRAASKTKRERVEHEAPRSKHEAPPNQEPLTINQEPQEKTETRKRAPVSVSVKDMEADGVDPQHAAEWMAVRKAKRLPLTLTGWDDTKAEATKAGLTAGEAVRLAVSNGWAGFKASWVASLQNSRNGQPTASASDIFAGAM